MKKLLLLFSCFILIFSSFLLFPFSQQVQAKKKTQSSEKIDQKLSEWALDEKRGYIYAISKESNQLLFIRLDSLKVEKQLKIGLNPSDIILDQNKLYIALSGSTSIAVVDVEKGNTIKTLATTKKPVELAIDGEKLFYISTDYSGEALYIYNLVLDKDEEINFHSAKYIFTDPDIAVDNKNHILYIGESGTSAGNAFAVSTNDYQVLHYTTYKDGYGFFYPERKIISDGSSVYYAGSKLKGKDLAVIDGTYRVTDDNGNAKTEGIVYARDQYAFSRTTVYDRDKYVPVMKLPVTNVGSVDNSNLVALYKSNNIALYDSAKGEIVKLTLKGSLPKVDYKKLGNKLVFAEEITDWAYDNKRETIYLIQKNTNKLLFVDANSFKVKKELFIGSLPTDVEYFDNKLFVALYGSNKVAIVHLLKNNKIDLQEITSPPYMLAVFKEKMYTSSGDQGGSLYKYSFDSQKSERISNSHYYPNYVVSDQDKELLFVVGDDVHVIDVKNDSEVEKINGEGKVTISKDDLFFGKHRRDRENLQVVKGTYDDPIIFAYDETVFSTKSLFDRETYMRSQDFTFDVSNVLVDPKGPVFLHSFTDKALYQYDSIESLKNGLTLSKLESPSKNIVATVGQPTPIELVATFKDGRKQNISSLAKWSVKDRDICVVNDSGVLFGYQSGSTVVTASFKEQSIRIPVTLKEVDTVKVSVEKITLRKGSEKTVTATAIFTDQSEMDVSDIANWDSSKNSVVKVSKGKLIATGEGRAIVEVSYGKRSARIEVQVAP